MIRHASEILPGWWKVVIKEDTVMLAGQTVPRASMRGKGDVL